MSDLWQQQLREAITDVSELCQRLKLDPQHGSLAACKAFKLRVPQPFVSRMTQGDYNDPLLLQVLPQTPELSTAPGYSTDPLQEQNANKLPGLLHKYHGRVLLMPTAGCAVNCRYCFRRHFPYLENTLSATQLQGLFDYIENDPSIYEVILSGSDPLLLKDAPLAKLIEKLSAIQQLRLLRVHTRLPIVIPERITEGLVTLLSETRLKTSIVLHCNHAQELDSAVAASCKKLTRHGIQLFNQSVLLAKINDAADKLIALSLRLYECNIVPYYLHLLDPVQGTAHFALSTQKAKTLIATIRAKLPGYLVPKLVREEAGKSSKSVVIV